MSQSKLITWYLVTILLAGCAGTQQAHKIEKSGFLGDDYAKLREGEEDQALLVYKNPNANWAQYKQVMIEPVQIWLGKDSQLNDVDPEDRKRLADELWTKMNEALQKDYTIVNQAGPGVLRISVAMTEADSSYLVLDTVSSIVPQARVLGGAKGLATGISSFTGSASVEAKFTDAGSGELLVAAVDRRGGTKNVIGATNRWNDIEDNHRYWAEKTSYRLCQWRGDANCVEPEE